MGRELNCGANSLGASLGILRVWQLEGRLEKAIS